MKLPRGMDQEDWEQMKVPGERSVGYCVALSCVHNLLYDRITKVKDKSAAVAALRDLSSALLEELNLHNLRERMKEDAAE